MSKQLHSSRLIVGLLSELEASQALVVCRSIPSDVYLGLLPLQVEILKPYENSILRIVGLPTQMATLSCEVAFRNRRLSFQIETSNNGTFKLPTEVTIVEARSNPRFNLSGDALPAEARFQSKTLIGTAYDISTGHVSILLPSPPKNIEIGTTAEVLFRSSLNATDIYFNHCKVVAITKIEDGTKVVFTHESRIKSTYRSRATRRSSRPIAIRFSTAGPASLENQGTLIIHERSLSGFLASVEACTAPPLSLIGLLLKSEDPKIDFYAVRAVGKEIAFQVLNSSHSLHGSEWLKFLDKSNSPESHPTVKAQELLDLLTESTFLKGPRREVYGAKAANLLVHTGEKRERALQRRFCRADDGIHLSHHMSTFRLTDSSWFIQEVASGVFKEKGISELKTQCVNSLADEAQNIPGSPGYLSLVFDPSVKTNWDFWGSYPHSLQLAACHIPLDLNTKLKNARNLNCIPVQTLSANERAMVSSSFLPQILDVLDYWANGWPNRTLIGLLNTLGSGHESSLHLLRDENNLAPIALIYRLKTHYAANVTGMLNSIFVFATKHNLSITVDSLITSLKNIPELTTGTNDVMLVGFQSNSSPLPQNLRKFQWVSIDLRKVGEKFG